MRLIDIDDLIEKHCEGCSADVREICKTDPVCATLMWFEEAPTIDAVPVVRCKDCKHWAVDETGTPWCDMWEASQYHEEVFCYFGELRSHHDSLCDQTEEG